MFHLVIYCMHRSIIVVKISIFFFLILEKAVTFSRINISKYIKVYDEKRKKGERKGIDIK
jgi:hypothetical protein